uniref:(northern house mosquito) hypothetical protein n=1 Tax=Culex pipiens TaxID=7175 RepID=A0A8D8F321_CULPI
MCPEPGVHSAKVYRPVPRFVRPQRQVYRGEPHAELFLRGRIHRRSVHRLPVHSSKTTTGSRPITTRRSVLSVTVWHERSLSSGGRWRSLRMLRELLWQSVHLLSTGVCDKLGMFQKYGLYSEPVQGSLPGSVRPQRRM